MENKKIDPVSEMSVSRTYGTIDTGQAGQAGQEESALIGQECREGTSIGHVRALRICCFVGLATIILAIVFLTSVIAVTGFIECGVIGPKYSRHKDWKEFKNQSFVVGFDLTAGYGTAAVAFENGTIINVARVEGTTEYNAVLSRLSLESSAHPTPPYYSCPAERLDVWRQWRRHFRKQRGFPASADVAAVADILLQLKRQTDLFLGALGPFEMAFITVPNLPALYMEDLVDAAEYAKFQVMTLPWWIHRSGDQAQWPVTELNAAYAGNGLGLDRNLSKPWSDNVLSVLLTKTALTAHVLPIWSAPSFYAAVGIANFSLGLSSCASDTELDCPASASYWSDIRLELRRALNSYFNRGHELGRVVSFGESAHNSIFDSILREEVLSAQSSNETLKRPVFTSFDPVFVAARGATIFARICLTLRFPDACFPDLTPKMQGW